MTGSALRGRTLAVYVFCCAIWGSTWLVIRIGVREIPPLTFAGLRMGISCLLLTPLAWRRSEKRTKPAEWRQLALSGVLQIGLAYAGIFLAARWIESGLSALLFSSFPIWVAVFAHRMLPNEPLTRRGVLAALMGLGGVAVIEGPAAVHALGGQMGPLFWGGILVLGSALISGYANVLVKKWLGGVPPARNVWGQTLVGSLLLFLLAAVFERGQPVHWSTDAILALAYLSIFGTVLTFVGLFWLVPRVPVAVIGTIPLVDMLIAVILGAVFLGEALPVRILFGGVLILAGVILTARGERRAA
ncbi:MAG TPA: EamA family transporter [Thermoanaerobaculia bacterium]|nr:EamA family transporter [Thermoanaerobaculia bacterium]